KGWAAVPAAVKVKIAENCSFSNCSFENLGGSGLWLSTGCNSCSVINSVFYDISGNGIMIGEGHDRFIDGEVWWKKVPEQTATGNMVDNCRVENCGVQFVGAIGIWCGITAETTIKNSEIMSLPYSGISIGWEWSPAKTPCRNNVIDGNHIHHIMQKLSDGGGIYMLGLQPDSKLINNQIHDVKINAGRAESNGMFLDEGTTDVVVANNLIYNIAKSPLRFHRATTNLVKENYLFCTGDNPPIRYNRTNEDDIKKVDNRVFSESDEDYLKELKKAIKKWK
ncbi:MAG: right-handed parallel beta-helix repeat-containing protein, partial [Draconibacterium sp.]|nr:right-handed parallel beta-helix repeat-containing protein [Draconibacterium sp.]